MAYDYINTVALLSLLGFVAVVYLVRLAVRGRAQFERVDRQGGSVLLGKPLMEMAYWALQPLARIMISLHLTPNLISWASLVFGGIAGTYLAYGYFGAAALFATLSAFLDSLDGMVARQLGIASDAGEVLDAAIDRYVEFFFMAGAVIYYRDYAGLQVIALFALMGSFMVSYSTAKAEALHMAPPPGIMRRPERAFYLILGAALSPLPMPWLEAKFPSAIPMGFPFVAAMFFIAVLSNISGIERLYTVALAIRMKEEAALNEETQTAPIDEDAEPALPSTQKP